jgi:hypothetical protein
VPKEQDIPQKQVPHRRFAGVRNDIGVKFYSSRIQIGHDGADGLFFRDGEGQACGAAKRCSVGERIDHVRHNEDDFIEIVLSQIAAGSQFF